VSYYVHHTPGRLRVRTPAIWKRDHKAVAVKHLYEGIEGVYRVEASSLTGSVTVFFDPDLTDVETVSAPLVRAGMLPAWGNSSRLLTAVQQSSRACPLVEDFLRAALKHWLGSLAKRSASRLVLRLF
jgi:hypothetical protein